MFTAPRTRHVRCPTTYQFFIFCLQAVVFRLFSNVRVTVPPYKKYSVVSESHAFKVVLKQKFRGIKAKMYFTSMIICAIQMNVISVNNNILCSTGLVLTMYRILPKILP